jgi:hypothetical protein
MRMCVRVCVCAYFCSLQEDSTQREATLFLARAVTNKGCVGGATCRREHLSPLMLQLPMIDLPKHVAPLDIGKVDHTNNVKEE